MNSKKILKIIFSIVITFFLVYFLLKQISITDIVNTLQNFPLPILLLTLFIYFLAYLGRALRFWYLTKKISFIDYLKIVCVHNLFTSLLPFRSGELSFIYYGGKKGEKKTKLLATLIISRFFDLVAVLIFFTTMVIMFGASDKNTNLIIFIVSGVIIAVVIAAIILINKLHLFKFKKLMKFKIYEYFINKVEDTLSYLKKLKPKKIITTAVISILIWALLYLESYIIIYHLGVTVEIYKIIMALGIVALVSIIPIHGIANLGTQELSWVVGIMFFGVGKELAISSGFGFHIISLLFTTVLGVIGLASFKH